MHTKKVVDLVKDGLSLKSLIASLMVIACAIFAILYFSINAQSHAQDVNDPVASAPAAAPANETVAKVYDEKGDQSGEFSSLEDAFGHALDNYKVEIVKDGIYRLPNILMKYEITKADGVDVKIDATQIDPRNPNITEVSKGCTFSNLEFNFGSSSYLGFIANCDKITMNKCTLNGLLTSYCPMEFKECNFKQDHKEYSMWAYAGDVTYNKCTFDGYGKYVNVYNEGYSEKVNVRIDDCVFNNHGSDPGKSALNVKGTCIEEGVIKPLDFDVVVGKNNSTNGPFPENNRLSNKLVMIDDGNSLDVKIQITNRDGQLETAYPPKEIKYKEEKVEPKQTFKLVSELGDGESIKWESSDENVCTVDQSGVVTMKEKVAPCQVTAEDKNCEITPGVYLKQVFNIAFPKLTFNLMGKADPSFPKDQWANPFGEQTIADPKVDQYKFVNWYTDDKLTTEFNKKNPVKEDTTIYAKWEAIPHETVIKITLDSKDATKAGCTTIYCKYSQGYFSDEACQNKIDKIDPLPVKDGFTFDGYWTSLETQNGDGKMLADKDGKLETTYEIVKSDATVYAKWNKNTEPGYDPQPQGGEQSGTGLSQTGDSVKYALVEALTVLIVVAGAAVIIRRRLHN